MVSVGRGQGGGGRRWVINFFHYLPLWGRSLEKSDDSRNLGES